MKADKLRASRKKLKYSMQDMADQLEIPKSTYARYEDGSAGITVDLINKVKALHEKDRLWFAGMDQRITQAQTPEERMLFR